MKEVSCKPFQVLLPPLERRGVALERVVVGTSLSVAELRSRKGRMEWVEACTILRNVRPYFSDDDLVELGGELFRPAAQRAAFAVARLLLTPMGFYRWLNRPRDGAGNQQFACIRPAFREISPHECEIELTLPPNYEPSREFFLLTRGSFEEAPRLFGYAAATVVMTPLPNGARFHITIPSRTPLLTNVRRAVTWPFAARAAARELQESNEELVERLEQLQQTTEELTRYKENLERMVDERTAQLREAQAARDRFFGNVSHEIRTPLSLIMLAAGDIDARARGALDERSRKSLGSISDAARKLVRLVDELLLLAAGQEDKLRLHPEPTDLAVIVDTAVSAWRPAAEAAGLELQQHTPKTLVVALDPVAIERVVSNLLSNAMKYTPRAGRVDIELSDGEDGVRLAVLDTGPGIDEDLAGRLFGRYERAAGESRRKQGTGIGLSLVKELVEGHGGKISALSRETGGTEMRIVFPSKIVLRDTTLQPARPRAYAPMADGPATIASGTKLSPPGLSAGTILIAEDDPQLAEMIAKLLAEEYTVVIGLDGQAAADLIGPAQPHLLVTDVDMPRMNGIDLARVFRQKTGDKLAPIIILSAVLDLGTRVAGLEAGAIDYVTKPFDPEELRARVRAQFRMRDMAMRLHRAEQLSSMGILVSGLAHEIRNPANGIVNAVGPLASLLPSELRSPESGVAQLLDVMKHCAGQIASMSKQLLSFRDGGQSLDMRPARVQEIVDRAITLAKGSLYEIELRKHVATDAELLCSQSLLVQVLTNLIENAAHAVGPGGWIEVQGRAEGGRITVEVADSGAGVPVEMRERVFEPFFTTKDPGKGTGLGLSVARAIVTRHGGVLEIRDKGTRPAFVMEIPQKVPSNVV